MKTAKHLITWILALLISNYSVTAFAACRETGVQLQILGSGGPGPASGRASSSYILWVNGKSRVMVDAGSGTKNLFHQSGANLNEIELIALSHLHPDHSAELPAILWPRGGSFALAGPNAAGVFPSIGSFTDSLFGEGGAFQILADRLDMQLIEVDTSNSTSVEVWRDNEIIVQGTGVPHANVPTIGYRIEVGDVSIAFSSDQNGSKPSFVEFIHGVDFLVIHFAASENTTGTLHAKPSVWGQMAAAAEIGHLIVSHISTSSSEDLQQNLAILRDNYSGEMTIAEDLMCVDLN